MEVASVFLREWESGLRAHVLLENLKIPYGIDKYPESYPSVASSRGVSTYILKEGWLGKRGEVNSSWKMRYFRAIVLDGGDVRVSYHAEADDSCPALGLVPCGGYSAFAFGPRDYLEVLQQPFMPSLADEDKWELFPAPNEDAVWYGIKLVPRDPYNLDGKRIWWLRVADKQQQSEWIEAFRQLCLVASPDREVTSSRRLSVVKIRDSEAMAQSLSPPVQVIPQTPAEIKYKSTLQQVFIGTCVRVRRHFGIEGSTLSKLRYFPGAEVQVLADILEPVLKRDVIDRLVSDGPRGTSSGGRARAATISQIQEGDRPDEIMKQKKDILWCLSRNMPPLPLHRPVKHVTSKQYESIVRPAATVAWTEMSNWVQANYAKITADAERGSAMLQQRKRLLMQEAALCLSEADLQAAVACANSEHEPPNAKEVGAALSAICKFINLSAPALQTLLDAVFNSISQACLFAFTAIHKCMEAGVGTTDAPGPLTAAILSDMDAARASDAYGERQKPRSSSNVVAAPTQSRSSVSVNVSQSAYEATKNFFRGTIERICRVDQPPAGEESEAGEGMHSLLWFSRTTLWALLIDVLTDEGLVEMLDTVYVSGGAATFDLLYSINMCAIREAMARVLNIFQVRVLAQIQVLQSEGSIDRLKGGMAMARGKIACKALNEVRREVMIEAVQTCDTLIRRQNRMMLQELLMGDVNAVLIPSLQNVTDSLKSAESDPLSESHTSIWSAAAVIQGLGAQVVGHVLAELVDVRMREGDYSVNDRLQALRQRVGAIGKTGESQDPLRTSFTKLARGSLIPWTETANRERHNSDVSVRGRAETATTTDTGAELADDNEGTDNDDQSSSASGFMPGEHEGDSTEEYELGDAYASDEEPLNDEDFFYVRPSMEDILRQSKNNSLNEKAPRKTRKGKKSTK